MLEMTLATEFVPGSNLKGKVTGANWLFLLPQLALQRVVCIGTPLSSTLKTLSTFCQELILVVPGLTAGSTTAVTTATPFKQITLANSHNFPLPNNCADLIVLADKNLAQQLGNDHLLRHELLRLLTPRGLVYAEWQTYSMFRAPQLYGNGKTGLDSSNIFNLTPFNGEMHTAVPHNDPATNIYFSQNQLTSPMLNLSKSMFKQAKKITPSKTHTIRPAPVSKKTTQITGMKQSKEQRPSLKQTTRKAGKGMLSAVQRLESFVDQKQPVQRFGVFFATPQGYNNACPPRYLREIAARTNINLDNYRWGLSARGEYSSRKMLFFLFDRTKDKQSSQPDYIVKMVRDSSFNYRLDNEAHALKLLAGEELFGSDILPRVIFDGHHAGLSIVGESIIEGSPFRQKTTATADCPYGRDALKWFVDLGAATADTQSATQTEIAAALKQLLNRFVAIYQPTPEQHRFLAQQITKIENNDTAVPLVFQHGDPGPWNMLVTPGGRVAVLDWEAAEPAGMPLWDLFYFMRSYSLDAARKQGTSDRLAAFKQQFLNDTPLGRLILDTVEEYYQRTGLDPSLIEPLFYTCWMHRSLKESMRLESAALQQGHFANLIWWCKAHRDSPTLSRLFTLPNHV